MIAFNGARYPGHLSGYLSGDVSALFIAAATLASPDAARAWLIAPTFRPIK